MMDEKYMPLALDYIDGNLSPEGEAMLQRHMAAGLINKQELDELAIMMGKLPQKEIEVPGVRMQRRFDAALREEIQKSSRKGFAEAFSETLKKWVEKHSLNFQPPQLAMGVLLLLIGAGIGYLLRPAEKYDNQLSQLTNEMQQMRELMILNMLEKSSSTERLRAVNMGHDLPEADAKIINALLHTLNHDSNVNVRLAAVEALRRHSAQPMVRKGLIESIEKQESPIVQIALADLMAELQERKAVEPMKKLLKEEKMDDAVRQKIEKSINVLI